MAWAELDPNLRHGSLEIPNIEDVEPLGPEDLPGLQAVQETIDRHKLTDRFNVALQHTHFDVKPGETLLTVREGDTLVTRPVLLDDVELAPGEELEAIDWLLFL